MSNNPIQAALKQVNVHDLKFVSLFTTVETGILGETEQVSSIIDAEAYERFHVHGFYNPSGTGFVGDRTHCDCCGHRVTYICIVGAPDNRFFCVGRDCFIALWSDAQSVESASIQVVRSVRRQRENVARERKIAEVAQQNAGFAEAYAAARKATGIAGDIADKIARYGDPSEKQVAFLIRWHAERLAALERVKSAPLVAGKATVQGTVASAKFRRVKSFYGGGDEAKLALVIALESGHKIYAKIPLGCPNDIAEGIFPDGFSVPSLVGAPVGFTATLEPSNDDATFVFAKRVTKLKINDLAVVKPNISDRGLVGQWADEANRAHDEEVARRLEAQEVSVG